MKRWIKRWLVKNLREEIDYIIGNQDDLELRLSTIEDQVRVMDGRLTEVEFELDYVVTEIERPNGLNSLVS